MRTIQIVGYRRIAYVFSLTLTAGSLLLLLLPGWGLKPGIDFTGGSLSEVTFSEARPLMADVSKSVEPIVGVSEAAPLGEHGVSLRFRNVTEPEHQAVLNALQKTFAIDGASVVEERFTTIGPTVGVELRQRAWVAVLTVLLAIILYISWAFRKVSRPVPSWQYGVVAIVALVHDVLITMGAFVLFGRYLGVEVGVLFVTALLTVLGFSVHDTIVVFDRVRENLHRATDRFSEVVNRSVNETLARSINTSLTTLVVLLATLLFGGESIRFFVLALIIGIAFGTYSSIFIASPLLVSIFAWREKHGK
ncbi:MAG: protein translocase subunit SecF [Patescibacteria group bacterium]